MDFERSFSTSLVVVLSIFVAFFREKISLALIFTALLLSLGISTLVATAPPDVNPLTLLGTLLWQATRQK